MLGCIFGFRGLSYSVARRVKRLSMQELVFLDPTNRNEGKKGNDGKKRNKGTFAKTALLQNRPFVSSRHSAPNRRSQHFQFRNLVRKVFPQFKACFIRIAQIQFETPVFSSQSF